MKKLFENEPNAISLPTFFTYSTTSPRLFKTILSMRLFNR